MDPNKSASAPPAWGGEKSPPPPYQDHPQYPTPGYPQPGPGYPQPGPGYPQPGPGYSQPGPGYPAQGYAAGPQGYGAPPQAYGQQPYPVSPGQQYPAPPGSVVVQPTVFVARGPLAQPVNDHMGYSIFTMLCCFLPLGVGALIYSIWTRDANMAGDQISAESFSRTARWLNHVSLGIGLTGFIMSMVYIFVILAN